MSVIENMGMREFRLKCARPLKSAVGTIKERFGYLFCLETKDHLGLGEASPLPGWTESFKACREALRHSIESIENKGVERTLYEISETPAARHGISLACQDLKSKENDEPLYKFLSDGDEEIQSVEVNAVVGNGTPDETAREAKQRLEEHYETIKIKAGKQSFKQDLTRLEAVRKSIGHDVDLRIDANGNWELDTIQDHMDRLKQLELEYLEQPLPTNQLKEHSTLRSDFDIALDESLHEHDLETIIDNEAADLVVIKPMCIGGLDRSMKFANQMMSEGLIPVVTTTIDTVVARTAAIHLSAAIGDLPACGLATAQFLKDDLCEDPAPVVNGQVKVPQVAGIGVNDAWKQLE